MIRFLAGVLFPPFAAGSTVLSSAALAVWAHPVTVRGARSFAPRVRLPRVEFGHIETTDPAVSD